jgi:hypothetical protein
MLLLLLPLLPLLLQPYGNLAAQAVQRFEPVSDLDRHHTEHAAAAAATAAAATAAAAALW